MFVSSFIRGLSAKILAVPVIVFFIGALIPGIIAYQLLQRNAERETHEKALMLLRTLDAVHRYADEEIGKRLGERHAASGAAKGVNATHQVMRRYETDVHGLPYLFRQVAENAPNPAQRADEYEARLIASFDADHKLRQIEDETWRKDGLYYVIAIPITAAEDRCLRGTKNVNPDKVVGASVIYIPTAFTRQQAANLFWTVFKIVGLLTVVCLGLLVWRTERLIARPVRQLLATSQAIRRGDWGAKFDSRSADELATLASSFQDTTLWLREQVAKEEKLRALFQQFIPASVAARALGKDADEILAGTRHSVTVMIINIRNFKLLMEHLPPEQTVTTLNEYFSEVNKVIVANRGLVSKYLGDTVMAFFGMPLGKEDHALDAVRAALSLPAALQNLYVRLEENYGWELGIGIGITTGEPIVGHFGSSEHMEYTVLGDVVSEAHRLEKLTKDVPEEDTILISEETYRRVMSDVHVFDLGEKTTPDGKTIHAYVVQGWRSEARKVLAA